MKVPCAEIARFIKEDLTKEVSALKKKKYTPKLLVILVGEEPEKLAATKEKQKIAKEIGIDFEQIYLPTAPPFLQFANLLKEKSQDPSITGIVIEQPLPISLQSDTLYNFIPIEKEIEGHRKKTEYLPSIGSAILTLLKYIYQNTNISTRLYADTKTDPSFFKQALKQKRIVLIGSGVTRGQPIAKTLAGFRINFINVNNQTFEPDQYYKDADIIIAAAGNGILNANNIKQGATLINIGDDGSYNENEIKNIAGFYTPIKGIELIDRLFLFKNLIQAAKIKK